MPDNRMPSSPASEPVRVFVGGTFDGLHRGHLFLLNFARRRGLAIAKQLGRTGVKVSVVIARDESVRRIKHRPPHHSQRECADFTRRARAIVAAVSGRLALGRRRCGR